MTYDHVIAVLHKYERVLADGVPEFKHNDNVINSCRRCHCHLMIQKMLTWEPDQLPRMFRWLGFLQGVLWMHGVYTIDEMREHNRGAESVVETEQENSHVEETVTA